MWGFDFGIWRIYMKKAHILEICLVMGLLSISCLDVSAMPYWLEEGSYAEYEISGNILTYGKVWGAYIVGTIRWDCLKIEDNSATIEETLVFSFPQFLYDESGNEYSNSIRYLGKEYVDMAKGGDYSFVTEFSIDDNINIDIHEPIEQRDPVTDEVIIDEDTGQPIMTGSYVVIISNVSAIVEKKAIVMVDIETRDVYDMEGNLFGRWLWWLNTDEYPLDGMVNELALYDWRGYEIPVVIRYFNMDMELTKKYWDMAFQYMVPEGTYDWFLMSNYEVPGYEDYDPDDIYYIPPITFRDLYDANTGYLIYSEHYGLADDISINIFDLEAHISAILSDTNIDFDTPYIPPDESSNIPYFLVFFILAILLVVSLMVVRRYNAFD